MVRSYLRHGGTKAFGIICSHSSNSVYDGKLAFVPALEDVLVWNVKKGQLLAMWHETGHTAEVTYILRSPKQDTFAVGYADGSIRLWDSSTGLVQVVFNGHKKAVTTLAFDEHGTRLASGSQDTDLIVWDVLSESGIYRLRGHRDQITSIRFLNHSTAPSSSTSSGPGYIITSSKDTFLKLWDLSTQHCIQTVVAHRSEVWCFDIDQSGEMIFTGSGEGELKAWKIDKDALDSGTRETDTGELTKMIHPISSLPLSTHQRVSQITFNQTRPFVAVQSADRSVEIFRVRTEEEVKKKITRRKKREKEKRGKGRNNSNQEQEAAEVEGGVELDAGDDAAQETPIGLVDLFTPYLVVRASGKIRSFDLIDDVSSTKSGVQLFVALASNALEIFSIPLPQKSKESPEAQRLFSLDAPGHRTDIRTLSLSSHDELLASASHGSLKIWNVKTTGCIRTLDCGYAICSTFLPGDKHVAIGTKSGEILLYDLGSSTLLETIKAHEGAVWSMHVRPDEMALVSGSADKDVKFWEIEWRAADEDASNGLSKSKRLSLAHIRTLKMTDDVLAVKYSPDGKLLAVALLDSTVKVFYQDTLKFFLSLYGHKLPVLSLDISTDSKLIVTSSADKNVKIWGLDFGDCHKSLFAHEESVMQVAFEKNVEWEKGDKGHSHYFWTVGKDRMVKYWDGDKFESIQKLEGHHGEVWALAVSSSGKFVVSGSHDKSIRIWEKTDEPLFLEEERERELEALYEKDVADTLNRAEDAPIGSGVEGAEVDTAMQEVSTVTKQTTGTLMAGERIIEALEIADEDRLAAEAHAQSLEEGSESTFLPPAKRNAILAALDVTPEEYVLQVVEKISGADLFDALLVLPFGKVVSLISYLNEWALREWNMPLVSRILFFLLKTHHHQIVANRTLRTILIPLRTHLRDALLRQKEEIGYNLAGLKFIRRMGEAKKTSEFRWEEIEDEEKVRDRIGGSEKKRKRVSLKA